MLVYVTAGMDTKNKWNKAATEGHIVYDSIYVKCPAEANL